MPLHFFGLVEVPEDSLLDHFMDLLGRSEEFNARRAYHLVQELLGVSVHIDGPDCKYKMVVATVT